MIGVMVPDDPLQAPVFRGTDWSSHIELLRLFLAHREEIVARIEDLLNAQRKPVQYLQDRTLLSRLFEDCFFSRPAVTASQSHLRGQLEQAYCDSGFTPRQLAGLYNDLIHPAEMMTRGFHFWHVTRWPGRKGRQHYAHTLFNVYLLRCLELLSMRIWDDDDASAGSRLAQIQGLLDELWRSSPSDQPSIVCDARWLIPLAQSLPTDDLAAYLKVARQVAVTLPEADAFAAQKAHVRMLGGHLTSQIRHLCIQGGNPIDDPAVLLRTRTSNALDFALLIQGLVALLKAYDRASQNGDERARLDIAGAVFQGISPDPELFLNRIDLLGPYSMIEHVFIATDHDVAGYSPLGQRHIALLKEYRRLIAHFTAPLRDDFPRFRPIDGGYSSYGAIFGYPSNLTELMALKTLERDAETRFSLEDVFADDVAGNGGISAAKLRWVDGLRKMPHVDPDVQRAYDYPREFAEDLYNRIGRELRIAESGDAPKTGRLYIVSATDSPAGIEDVPTKYFASTDQHILAAHKAEPYELARLRHERQEAHFLVSYETNSEKSGGGWLALKKDLLDEVLGEGRDARIVGLPPHRSSSVASHVPRANRAKCQPTFACSASRSSRWRRALVRQRNELLIVAHRELHSLLPPVFGGLLEAILARRHEVPQQEPLADRLARKDHQDRFLYRLHNDALPRLEHGHLSRIKPLIAHHHRSGGEVNRALGVLGSYSSAGAPGHLPMFVGHGRMDAHVGSPPFEFTRD